MKLEKYALIAEIVSGVAIVVTLVILIFEIRGNTGAIRDQTAQNTFALSFQATTFQSEAEARVLGKLEAEGWEALHDTEAYLAAVVLRAHFTTYDNHYYQYRRGNLDEDIHRAYEERIIATLLSSATQEWWSESRAMFTEPFQLYVNELLREHAN